MTQMCPSRQSTLFLRMLLKILHNQHSKGTTSQDELLPWLTSTTSVLVNQWATRSAHSPGYMMSPAVDT